MLHLSLNLPKYRLSLHLAKRRGSLFEEPIIPNINEIKNTRSGNKVSRFFRHIFEHKHIKKILGGNFALLIIASSVIPNSPVVVQPPIPSNVISITQTLPFKTESGVQLPLEHMQVNQGFSFFHPAVDLAGQTGDPVKPIMSGFVEEIYRSRFDYGNAIIVNHANQITSLYAHLSKINVRVGENVGKDTVIGLVGQTGHTTGPHLHLEIRDHGVQINPLTVLPR